MAPVPGALRPRGTPPGVYAMALRALRVRDPEHKCECADRLLEAWRAGDLQVQAEDPPAERIEVPGRPARPALVRPQELPRRGLHTERGRQALLHAIAHIEFNAINLALDAVYRFRELPAEFVSDWLQVAAEEARHFRVLSRRLHETGCDYGSYGAHNGLWEMAVKTDADPMERMALVPRVLEARGLDVTPGMIRRLEAAGDTASAAVLEVIQREEVGHVAIGSCWFRFLARQRGLDPEATFLDLLVRHMPGRVRPPFALDARLAAGFSRREMAALAAQAGGWPASDG
ncbi:ferritin-like domain-containing protein [Thioalkalivibrio nitratireducens]